MDDPRRRVPRTDAVLADARLQAAVGTHGRALVKQAVLDAQQAAREGRIEPEQVAGTALALLRPPHSGRAVLNATGVVVHTNIGRAPLSSAALAAMTEAAGYLDLEMSLATGRRSRRGAATEQALLDAVPEAEAALVVNNGAAALMLATTALAAGRELVVSRGELVEIGAGFRLPELIEATGVRLREVGTTNRTHLADYRTAIGEQTGAILKVHPSNFRVEGFTSEVTVAELAGLTRPDGTPLPVIADVGSGLLAADRALPDEPDAASWLRAGAAVVTASGDKLLGGPQAGILVGSAEVVERLRRHPMARALRVDKLTVAALEATLRGPEPPVTRFRRLGPDDLRDRTTQLAERVGGEVVSCAGRIGGGGAPGLPLPGLAVALAAPADRVAQALRTGTPAVLARVEDGRCLVDLRCIEAADDEKLAAAVQVALDAVRSRPLDELGDQGGVKAEPTSMSAEPVEANPTTTEPVEANPTTAEPVEDHAGGRGAGSSQRGSATVGRRTESGEPARDVAQDAAGPRPSAPAQPPLDKLGDHEDEDDRA